MVEEVVRRKVAAEDHHTAAGEAGHMADSAEGPRIVVGDTGLEVVLRTAVAEVEDTLAAVGMDYGREVLHTEVVGEGGSLGCVGPGVVDILLAARNLEGVLESRHSLAGAGNLAEGILEGGIVEVEAAGILLLRCQLM